MDNKLNIKDTSKNRYDRPPKIPMDLKMAKFSEKTDASLITKISDKTLRRKKILSRLAENNSKTRLPVVKNIPTTVNVEQDELTQNPSNINALRYEEIKNRIQNVSYLFGCLTCFY